MEALGVEPMHPTESGQFDVFDALPRAVFGTPDQLTLVGGVDGLGQRVVVRVADAANRRCGSKFTQFLAIAN